MTEYLVFTLTANLGAMGELAGHERRGSLDWPGHSALIGLLGAALGRRRTDDFTSLDALQTAVAIFDSGAPLRDYHTVQTVPSAKARRPQSRPAALRSARGSLNTIITLRDYRSNPLYGIAVWGEDAQQLLQDLRQALQQPVFSLYLGRRSCPLAAPLVPRIVQATDLEQALAQIVLPPWRQGAVAHRLVAAANILQATRSEQRHDVAINRRRWHFGERQLGIARVKIAPEVVA